MNGLELTSAQTRSQNLVCPCKLCSGQSDFRFQLRNFDFYKCRTCGVTSTWPEPDTGQITRHYRDKFHAGNYQIARQGDDHRRTCAQLAAMLARYIGPNTAGQSILDIGCFTGEFLTALKEGYGLEVNGVELQSEAVEIANARLPGRIIQLDVHSDEFPNRTFDVVSVNGVIEHVLDPIRLISRAKDLLAPNGVLMLQTPNCESIIPRLAGKLWPAYAPVEHIHVFSKRGLLAQLRDLGFTEIVCVPHWKRLSVEYVFQMMNTFGPELRALIKPLFLLIPFRKRLTLPFYVGEMVVFARKGAPT